MKIWFIFLFFSLAGSDRQWYVSVFKSSFRFESCSSSYKPRNAQENMALVERMEAMKQELEAEKLKCSLQ